MNEKDLELRERIRNTRVYKTAVSLHKAFRDDPENLDRFKKSWEEEIFMLIKLESLTASPPTDYSAAFKGKDSGEPFDTPDSAEAALDRYVKDKK